MIPPSDENANNPAIITPVTDIRPITDNSPGDVSHEDFFRLREILPIQAKIITLLGCLFQPDETVNVMMDKGDGEKHIDHQSTTSLISDFGKHDTIEALIEINHAMGYNLSVSSRVPTRKFLHAVCRGTGGKVEMLKLLERSPIPMPAIIIECFPGVDLFWKLDKPIDLAEWEELQGQLAHALGASHHGWDEIPLPQLTRYNYLDYRSDQPTKIIESIPVTRHVKGERKQEIVNVYHPESVTTPEEMSIGLSLFQVKRFSECVWHKEDTILVRVIKKADAGTRQEVQEWITTGREFCEPDNYCRMRVMNERGFCVYAGINPLKAGSTTGGNKNVKEAGWLFADFDSPDGTPLRASNIQRVIHTAGLPSPTIINHTGYGIHAFWKLAKRIKDLKDWSSAQRALITLLGSDEAIKDPARIMRVPGFKNMKNKQGGKQGGKQSHPACFSTHFDPSVSPQFNFLKTLLFKLLENKNGEKKQSGMTLGRYLPSVILTGLEDESKDKTQTPETDNLKAEYSSGLMLNEMVENTIWVSPLFDPRKNGDRNKKRMAIVRAVYGRAPDAPIENVLSSIVRPWFDLYAPNFPTSEWSTTERECRDMWNRWSSKNETGIRAFCKNMPADLCRMDKLRWICRVKAEKMPASDEGTFCLSIREACLSCGFKSLVSARRAFVRLIADGTIALVRRGQAGWVIGGRASEYRLVRV